jgi:hypothetical protein
MIGRFVLPTTGVWKRKYHNIEVRVHDSKENGFSKCRNKELICLHRLPDGENYHVIGARWLSSLARFPGDDG